MVVRRSAVAGRFYPQQPKELAETIHRFLRDSEKSIPVDSTLTFPKGLVVPHAGYPYSGKIAAQAYSQWLPLRNRIQRVVLVGPSHYIPFQGIGMTSAVAFETPLGSIPIDEKANRLIAQLPFVSIQDEAHAPEHSLEVQLPFLQVVLENFQLVPLVYSRATPEQLAEVLERLWGGPETLILISSDLSHFLDDATCRSLDAETAGIIEKLDVGQLDSDRACGAVGIQGLMIVARKRGLRIHTIALKNSAETSGDFDRVVGYGGFVLQADENPASPLKESSAEVFV